MPFQETFSDDGARKTELKDNIRTGTELYFLESTSPETFLYLVEGEAEIRLFTSIR